MKRRIAFISEHASPLAILGGIDSGGQNVYVGELARRLAEIGYVIDIFTRLDNPLLPPIVTWHPHVRVIHITAGPVAYVEKESLFGFMDEFAGNMIRFMLAEEEHYQLVHANFWMSGYVAMQIKEALAIPFVITFHALGHIRRLYQGDHDRFPKERIDVEYDIIQRADQVIAECPQDLEDLVTYYDASPGKITVIPCGFNPNEFHPLDRLLARMALSMDAQGPVILQLGRIVPRKGIDNVIRAIAHIRRTREIKVKLVVVGGEKDWPDDQNPEVVRLQRIAEEEQVSDCVELVGRKSRDMLKYYYAAADIFITTPWYEPFGITPLEAMACAIPVIGSDVGGIKFSVIEGKTGYLVPPKDPAALAAKIMALLDDPQLREEMGKNAQRRVNAFFTWPRIAGMVSRLYERVIRCQSDSDDDLMLIEEAFDQASETFSLSRQVLSKPILEAAALISDAFRKNRKMLICGNGGSAAESQHFAAELVGRFELPGRQALPALALTADSSVLTAWANDIDYDQIFARQVEAFGARGDILFCFTTSGQSANILHALKTALNKGMVCITLTGKGGGEASQFAHVDLQIPSAQTQRIQELHVHVMHTLCCLVEKHLNRRREPVHINGHEKSMSTET